MRFHHSTRRGRTKFSQGGGPHHRASGGGPAASHSAISNRWAQLSYCRQTNIHFNRRLPVEVPEGARNAGQAAADCGQEPARQGDGGSETLAQHMGQLCVAERGSASEAAEQQRDSAAAEKCADATQQQTSSKTSPSRTGGRMAARTKTTNSRRSSMRQNHQTTTTATLHQDKNQLSSAADQKLDMEGARERLIAQVEKHPFWSNKAAKRMRLLDLIERRIFIYELVSYCEKRDLEWRYEPYRGGLATGAAGAGGPGVRRVLSSVGARQALTATATSLLPTDANNNSSCQNLQTTQSATLDTTPLKSQRLRPAHSTVSQPASPMEPPSQTPSMALHSPIRRHQFAFEETTDADQSPEQKLQLVSQSQQLTAEENDNKTPSIKRQTIRRSLSSAVATSAEGGQLAGQATLALEGALSWGEPRPLPSAELVWSIEPPERLRPAPFASYIHTTEVPDSSFVKRCHGCQGRGRLKCTSCYGVGYEVCISCSGKGTMKSLAASGASAVGGSSHFGGGGSSSRRADSSSSSGGQGMWNNASDSESRYGSGRHGDEPGGISGGSGSGGGASSWTTESCHFCHGAGQKRCWICAGRAYNTCTACAGTGQLRCFLNLNITWTNHRDECVLNNADAIIPRDRLRLSSGLLLADEVGARLAPIAPHSGPMGNLEHEDSSPIRALDGAASDYRQSGSPPTSTPTHVTPTRQPQQQRRLSTPQTAQKPLEQMVKASELNQLRSFSAKLLEKHANQYERCERLLRQRHRVTQIECYLVNWEWKRRRGHFVIYGDERKVYIAKYPFKSICNIT